MDKYHFTKREKDVLILYAQGKKHQEIADELCISLHTMRTHWRNIKNKSDIKNMADVFQYVNHHLNK